MAPVRHISIRKISEVVALTGQDVVVQLKFHASSPCLKGV